jgi:hypothetical protein
MEPLYAKEIENNFENYIVECPYCNQVITFNRSTDLKHLIKPFHLVAGCAEVDCLNPGCKESFWIRDNVASEKHKYLIFDCIALIKQKRYMACIINLCTACEALFLKGLEARLLWEPWSQGVFERDVKKLNQATLFFHKQVRSYSFVRLRNLFFNMYLNDRHFGTLKAIQDYIEKECYALAKKEPSQDDLAKIKDPKTRELFEKLKQLSIHDLRNEVAHKYVFRPGKRHVEKHFEEVKGVVIGLEARLPIEHQISYFIK